MFDPARASLRYRIDSGRCLGVSWLALGSAALVEIAARQKPDGIVIDLQHGLFERRDLEAAIGIVPPEIPVIARTAENTPFAMGMALDAGAEAVMVPLIETAGEARRAVLAAKYPPIGQRSGGGVRPLGNFVENVAGDHKIVVIVMIETAKGVANAAEIAAVEGVDMVFIGTGDLSLSIGTFPKPHHDHASACAAVHRACRAAWTPCGIFTMTAEAARQRRDQGYRMVVTANDIDLAANGFGAATQAFAAQPAAPVAADRPARVIGR
jgi:2-keto-3-deoxy-L-rhamnonate aldolase RhmA